MCSKIDVATALVLAGSRGGFEPVAHGERVCHKALVRVGQMTMLEHVVAALREANFSRLLVSTAEPEVIALATRLGMEVVEPGVGPSESVSRAFALVDGPMLVTTADHPLLMPQWIVDFVADTPPAADVTVMLAERGRVESAVPGTRRTWLRFADGDWSGCNLFLLVTPEARHAIAHWRMVESERKRPWRIAARLGWATLFDYATGRLALSDAIGRVGARMGVRASLVQAKDGLAAVDVDKAEDLQLVRAIMSGAPVPQPAAMPQSEPAWHWVKAFFPFFPTYRVSGMMRWGKQRKANGTAREAVARN